MMKPDRWQQVNDLYYAALEPVGGAVPLDSEFYIERGADAEFHEAIARGDSIVLVKGARQVGKTSLLARGPISSSWTRTPARCGIRS